MWDFLVGSSVWASFVLVGSWGFGFCLVVYMLVGWTQVYRVLDRVSHEGAGVVGSSLLLLWLSVGLSFVFPLGVVFCPARNLLAVLSCCVALVCFWVWLRFVRFDKRKYIKRIVIGCDFADSDGLDEIDFEDLIVLGRRRRMQVMFEEFRELQVGKRGG